MFAFRIAYQRNRRRLGRIGLMTLLLTGLAMAAIPLPGADASNGPEASPVPELLLVPQAFDTARFAQLSFKPSVDWS